MSRKDVHYEGRKSEEKRALFEAAKEQLRETGAIDLMERVAGALPNATLTIEDDFNTSPILLVMLRDQGEREVHAGDYQVDYKGRRILATTTARELLIFPHHSMYPDVATVQAYCVEEGEIEGQGLVGGRSMIWEDYGIMMRDLGASVRRGIAELYPHRPDIQANVEAVISPPVEL